MTVLPPKRAPWAALTPALPALLAPATACLVCLLVACQDSTPTADALCARAAGCEQMDVLVSADACARQIREHLKDSPPHCANCVLSLPCSGMARVATGAVSLNRICPECAGNLSVDACGPAHEHVLICGLSTRPAASASAAASGSAAPKGSAAPGGTGAPAALGGACGRPPRRPRTPGRRSLT